MEVIEDVKHNLGDLITKKFDGDASVRNVVEFLWGLEIINKKTALRHLIRADYYESISDQTKSMSERKTDLAVKYDVELDFVRDAIYKYRHLQI